MESKKINQLATELTPSLDDLTIIGDPSTGISKKITLSQMAALFTGTVEEYASLAAFPLVGVADTIYIATDTNILYRWSTSLNAYVELSPNIISSLVFNDSNGFDGTISLVGSTATLTITTTLTSGSVAFGGASGALSQDNTNFYWDNSNKRLGINTNAPTVAFDVFGSGIIGRVNGTSTNNAFLGFASNGTNKWSIGNVQSDHRFRIYNEATTSELVSVLQTGEFGIGIANPTTKFHIDGAASALILNLDANVSIAKSISFRSDNSNRWNIEVSGTESTGNAGMDYFLRSYSDAGALIETPLSIVRSTGVTTIKSLTLTNALSPANGGTGITSYTIGDLIYASGSTTLAKLADVATGNALISGGVGVAPSWGKIDLTTTITGTLPVANGGTGATTFTAGRVLFGNGTSAINTSPNVFFNTANNRFSLGENGVTNGYLIIWNGTSNREGNIYGDATYGLHFDTNSNARPIRIDGSAFEVTSATTISNIVGINGANEAGWAIKINGNGKVESGSGTTVFQINDTTTGAKAWSLISAGVGNTHSVPVGTFYLRNSTDGTTALRISSGGNIGVGVAVASWVSTARAIQVGGYNSLSQQHNGSMNLVQDAFENASNSFAYGSTGGLPTRINMNPNDGAITFFNAAAGTSGNTITWNTRMVLPNSGDLYLGDTSFTSPNGADRFMGIYGGQDCSLILRDAVQTWELYVNDDFYLTRGSTSVLTALRSNGNVGIGISPSYKLDVSSGASGIVLNLEGTNAYNAETGIQMSSGRAKISGFLNGTGGTPGTTLRFYTMPDGGSVTEVGRFTSQGFFKQSNDGATYVGLTTSRNEFNSTINGNNTIFSSTNTSLNTDGIVRIDSVRNTTDNTYYVLTYYNGGTGTYRFRVADSGNVTNTNNSYGQISDIKHKENIFDASSKLEDLLKVRIVNFNFKNDKTKQIGVIAQELEQIFPSMIEEAEDFEEVEFTDEEGNVTKEKQSLGTFTKSVKYSVFVPMLIKAMQEQQAQIEELKALIK